MVIRGKFVIEIYILFAQEAEMHVHKNCELMLSTLGTIFLNIFYLFFPREMETVCMKFLILFSGRKKKKETRTVFSERKQMSPTEFSGFFSTTVTLKIRSRSPKSNKFFVMSQLYIHENLERISTTG